MRGCLLGYAERWNRRPNPEAAREGKGTWHSGPTNVAIRATMTRYTGIPGAEGGWVWARWLGHGNAEAWECTTSGSSSSICDATETKGVGGGGELSFHSFAIHFSLPSVAGEEEEEISQTQYLWRCWGRRSLSLFVPSPCCSAELEGFSLVLLRFPEMEIIISFAEQAYKLTARRSKRSWDDLLVRDVSRGETATHLNREDGWLPDDDPDSRVCSAAFHINIIVATCRSRFKVWFNRPPVAAA